MSIGPCRQIRFQIWPLASDSPSWSNGSPDGTAADRTRASSSLSAAERRTRFARPASGVTSMSSVGGMSTPWLSAQAAPATPPMTTYFTRWRLSASTMAATSSCGGSAGASLTRSPQWPAGAEAGGMIPHEGIEIAVQLGPALGGEGVDGGPQDVVMRVDGKQSQVEVEASGAQHRTQRPKARIAAPGLDVIDRRAGH